jgi:hypothetical protein
MFIRYDWNINLELGGNDVIAVLSEMREEHAVRVSVLR